MSKIVKKINKNKYGFTLMEVVVAVAIFAVASIILTDIYVISQRTETKLAGQTKVQSDARYVMEVLAREIRMNYIDYDYILSNGGFSGDGLEYLPLVDEQDNTIRFAKKTFNEAGCKSTVCLAVARNNSGFASITPEGVTVTKIKFYVYPEEDPFTLNGSWQYPNNIQPRVTIVLVSETIGTREVESSINYLQTTVSSRQYKR